jgi:hypothetical protein
MQTIEIKTNQKKDAVISLLKTAVESQITRYQIALEMADKRLQPFEKKYGVTSEYFMENMTAEDLEGKDEEYVNWAGEYKLRQRLVEKLTQIQDIDYGK